MSNTLLPRGETLRRAVRWLSDEGRHDPAAIEEAAVRFDLSPLEEEFLLREAAAARKRALAPERGSARRGFRP